MPIVAKVEYYMDLVFWATKLPAREQAKTRIHVYGHLGVYTRSDLLEQQRDIFMMQKMNKPQCGLRQ